jgi:ligand-binding sensor domain-containing protein
MKKSKSLYALVSQLLCLCFVLFSTTLFAQSDWGSDWKFFRADYVYDNGIRQSEKLASDTVNAADWAADGSYWFAVGDEINVYQGRKVRTIGNRNFGNAQAILSLKWDGRGQLWIGTTAGLYKMTADESFEVVNVPEIKVVSEIAIGPKNHVYITGYSSDGQNASPTGLGVFDGQNWKNYNKENSDFPSGLIEEITFDREGNLWAINGRENNGVVKFDGTKWTFFKTENSGLQTNQVRAIAFDNQNNAWFGTPNGVVKFDGITWRVFTLKELINSSQFSINLRKDVPEPELLSMAIDQNDAVWIGTNGNGVIRMQGDARTVFTVANSPMTSNHVRSIKIDELNRKWFITGSFAKNRVSQLTEDLSEVSAAFAGVVVYLDPIFDMLKEWLVMNAYTAEQPGNSFYEMQQDQAGNMWLASSGYGLVKYAESGWSVFRDPYVSFVGEMLTSLAVGDEIYAGAQLNGLFLKEDKGIRQVPQTELNYGKRSVRDLAFDDEGNLWIAHISGVNMCKDGTCKSFTKKNGLLSNNVFALKKDSKGRMWVCSTKGASVYDKGFWTFYDKRQSGLKGYVFDVVEDKTGTFWAGTREGLFKLAGEKWTLIEPNGPEIPGYISIKCMAVGLDGTLWIGTATQGVFTRTTDGVWQHFDSANSGVLFGEIRDIAIAKNGDVWISAAKETSTASKSTATGQNPGEEIEQEILNFDPSAALIIYKKPSE